MITITVLPTVGQMTKISTEVMTLGELKPILLAQGLSTEGVSLIIGETKNELSTDSALLPNHDFKLFIFPKNTKSGVHPTSVLSLLDSIKKQIKKIKNLIEDGVSSEDEDEYEDDTS